MKAKIVLALFLVIAMNSCKCTMHPCTEYRNGTGRLEGFTKEELDKMVIRRYDSATGFSLLVDTAIQYIDFKSVYTFSDTRPYKGYNVEISIPSVARTVRITEIKYEPKTYETCPGGKEFDGCESPLLSCIVDGAPFVPGGSGWFITIRK